MDALQMVERIRANVDDDRHVQDFKSSRNTGCFEPLFRRYARRVFVLAYAFHRDRAQAEDCVQETFLRAFVEIDKYDETVPDGNFWAWLQTIARNVCIDELRRTKRHLALDKRVNYCFIPLTQEKTIMLQELHDQLNTLPHEYRLCYLLSSDGYSYKEIMKITGFAYEQVKTFIQTAKRRVRRQFR